MKASVLEDYYQRATKKLPHPAAQQIIELVEEVRRLRDLHTKRKVRRDEDLDDDCEITFGTYAGERLADVPDDYLLWWRAQNPVDGLAIDAQFATYPRKAIARQQLRLYEYITKRVRTESGDEPILFDESGDKTIPIASVAPKNGHPEGDDDKIPIIPDEPEDPVWATP